MVGAAYSFAFNGNFVICGGFSTLTNNSSLSSLALEPTDRTSFCVASPLYTIKVIKKATKVALFCYWRWWESNPRPLWIKTNIYECSNLFAQPNKESHKT